MHRFDYHLHTHHSPDGEMTVAALCEAAIGAGLDEICITDHTDIGHPDVEMDRPEDMAKYFAEIAAARESYPGLLIRAGLEMGDNAPLRDEVRAWHRAQPLDFCLLSLHIINGLDPYFQKYYETGTRDELYRRYLEERLTSVISWPPEEYDALAHLGYCAKFAPYPVEVRPLRHADGPDLLDAIFRRLAENGKALEINTSGHKTIGECFPDRQLLLRFRELGGEFVTLGSDAHQPATVGRWIDDGRSLAKSCGFQYAATYERRRCIPVLL